MTMDRQIPKQQLGGKPQQLALKQALATTLSVTSQLPQTPATPSSPQLLAHLTAPQTIRTSSTTLPFHFPFTVSSLSSVTCTQAVGRLLYSQPISLASSGFTVVSPSSSIPAIQVLGSSSFQSHLSSTGMMVLPTLPAGQVKVSTSVTTSHSLLSVNAPEASRGLPVILQAPHSGTELNFIMTSPASQLQQPPLLPSVSRTMGGTVHHKGISGATGDGPSSKLHAAQSPAKELSFAHLKSQLQQESSFSLAAKSKRPRSDSGGMKGFGLFETSASSLDDASGELPPAKKVKLEPELSNDSEVVHYRDLYCMDRETELEERNKTYQSLVTELFFLENRCHFMDYFVWMKRATANGSLIRYLRARKAEDLGEYSGHEKSINNEVKVLTTSGGTLPIVTPVAISKTLPPAITAMQQQQENGGIPLSTTAATTTVGSPPPYTVESSSSSMAVVTIVAVTTTTSTMTPALPRARLTEGICQPNVGPTSCHVTDVYQPSLMLRDQLPDPNSGIARQSSEFSVRGPAAAAATPTVSQEAVIELAKQEAQVMQRIAELRKQGLWSLKQLPKVQELSRLKSPWDYLLEEMQWMAVDFAQERRWKMSCAKHVADSITKQHNLRQQGQKLRQNAEEKRLKILASSVGKMINDFWSGMVEMALYKRQKDAEIKHRKILDYVTRDLVASQSEPVQEAVLASEMDASVAAAADNNCVSSEIQDLIAEGEMPLDELVQKYAGAYSKEFEEDFLQHQTDSPESSGKNDFSEVENVEPVEGVELGETVLGDVTDRPKDLIEQMCTTAVTLQPMTISCDLETENCKSSLMKLRLWDYQLVGSNWISAMHQRSIGCVLCDEEGLGKKVQAAYFLSCLASEHSNWGPHLIVTSSRFLFIWQMIFSRWCPALKIFVYYGDASERVAQRLKWLSSDCGHYHICVTSYRCLQEDVQHFYAQSWNCLILDQAACLDAGEACELLNGLSCDHRLLLTDVSLLTVPPKELFSLILLTLSVNLRHEFKAKFSDVLSGGFEGGTAEQSSSAEGLVDIARVLSLRRLKQDVSGQLPKLDVTTVLCPLSKRQQTLYTQLTSSDRMKDLLRTGAVVDVLSLVLKLKKLCNHPDLVDPCSLASPVVLEGISLSMPALLDNVLEEESRNRTDAWSAMTSLLHLEVDSESTTEPSLVPRRKPMIEELISGGSVEETSMEVDAESTDGRDQVLASQSGNQKFPGNTVDPGSELLQSSISKDDAESVLVGINPLYGASLQGLLRSMTSELAQNDFECNRWSNKGYMLSSGDSRQLRMPVSRAALKMDTTDSLLSLLNVSADVSKDLTEKVIPKVYCHSERIVIQPLASSDSVKRKVPALEPSQQSLVTENRVQLSLNALQLANSGKLQLLDVLMKRLISEQRRVVILSHMVHVLDLLEAYLDKCKLLYMRIESSTKVEKRHLLVHRFNTNSKIYCLLMSSRMPFLDGIEWPCVNAVVLYDVDLSPAMSQHTERMIHSMVQASSLMVFKFVTKDTVEEVLLSDSSILRKGTLSNGEATYTKETVNRLFKQSSFVEEVIESGPSMFTEADFKLTELPEDIFEMTLNSVEDAEDAEAAFLVRSQNVDACGPEADREVLQRILESVAEKDSSDPSVNLSQIEEYAVSVVERQMDMLSEDSNAPEGDHNALLKLATPLSKKRKCEGGELGDDENKENLAEEADREEEDDEALLLTYPVDRENKQVFVSDVTGEQMPLWMPPTPPQDDSDIYIDHSLFFLYEPSIMSESQLPPVYVKKGHKRMKMDNANTRRVKLHRDEQPSAPRSLFERPAALLRYEREARLMKQGLAKAPVRPVPEPPSDQPDWLIHEDWALLQAYQMHQDLPVSFSSNWDLIADIVNACSRTYRSPKQCKNRFENVILPREEGKFLYDINPRKLKKSSKGLYKTKNNQPMRTNQLYVQDNNRTITTCFTLHFDTIKSLAAKRSTAPPSSMSNIGNVWNAKHIAVLADFSINYDQPLLPLHIAAMRAERLAKDKKQPPTAATVSASDQQPAISAAVNTPLRLAPHQASGTPMVLQTGQPTAQTILQTGQQVIPGQHIATAPTAVVSAPLSGQDGRQQQMTIVQAAGQQLQAVASGPSAILATSLHKVAGSTASVVTSVSLPRSLTMTGIVVTQATALSRPQTVVTSAALVNLPTSLNQTVRTIRNVSLPFTIRDAVTPTISHNTINLSSQDARSLGQVIATTGLTTAQLVVTQQKPAIGLPQLSTGSVQQHMLNLTAAAKSQNAAATLPGLQLQMRQQRVGSTMLQQVRSVPLSAMQVQSQMTALLRKQPQAKTALAGTVQGSVNVQQIPRQQIEGATLQQQQQQQAGTASSTVTQSVTTLLKAVSPAASVSTVTIPVSAVTHGINVTHPKLLSGKIANSPHQVRQVQVSKRGPTVQFTASKVTGIGQITKSVSSPVILQQQKYLPQPIPGRLQQFIASSSGTVIAAQIIQQSNAQQTLPASISVAPATSKASVTVTIAGSGLTGVATIPMSSLCQVTNQTNAVVTTAVKVMPTQATYAKQSKDGSFLGIQKTTMVVPAGLQQVMVRPAAAQQPAGSQLLQGAHITMATSNKTVASLTPVEKAVQEVVQQAQAQARQVPPISFTASNVSSTLTQGSQAQVVAAVPAPQHLLVTSVTQAVGQSSATTGQVSGSSSPATGDSQNKLPPVKIRNQRS